MAQPSLLEPRVPGPAKAGRYRTVLADPPWLERGGGQVKRGADRHYELMPTPAIAALPVRSWAADDAHLYLWVTNNFMPDGFEVMKAWGFRFVTVLTWIKGEGALDALDDAWLQVGLGQYFRGCTEHVLFGVRGQVEYRQVDGQRAQGRTAFFARRGEHSVKPEQLRAMAERVSHGPRLEMFARRPWPEWDVWGLEAPVETNGVS
jgi:N6-adenosine-specific RNA methylase IME4